MISERIIQLLAKKMGHDASDEEQQELTDLLQQYPEHDLLVETLLSIKGEKSHQEPALHENSLVQKGWQMLKQDIDNIETFDESKASNKEVKPVKRKLVVMWLNRAAIWGGIVLLFSVFFMFFNKSGDKKEGELAAKIKEVGISSGAPVKKILPDGSLVWLNAGSHIRYDDNFVKKTRDVYLEGEAFFNVAHDPAHPFVVHAGNITVRALGTEFNVNAYNNQNKIVATLVSGKIMVKIDGKPDQSIILIPNEKLTVTNDLPEVRDSSSTRKELSFEVKEITQIHSDESVPEVAWMQDKLAFQNEAFDDVAKRMGRRYDINIVFKDKSLGKERLTGIFENENIKKALTLLQMTTPFRYELKGDTVYLRR